MLNYSLLKCDDLSVQACYCAFLKFLSLFLIIYGVYKCWLANDSCVLLWTLNNDLYFNSVAKDFESWDTT